MNNMNDTNPINLKTNILSKNHEVLERDIFIFLYGNYMVLESFYKNIQSQIEEALPFLERDMQYTVEMLCDPNFWKSLNPGQKKMAGRCVAHMVMENRIQLSFAGKSISNSRLYTVN